MSLAAESVEVVPEQVWFFDKNGANFWAMVVALLLPQTAASTTTQPPVATATAITKKLPPSPQQPQSPQS